MSNYLYNFVRKCLEMKERLSFWVFGSVRIFWNLNSWASLLGVIPELWSFLPSIPGLFPTLFFYHRVNPGYYSRFFYAPLPPTSTSSQSLTLAELNASGWKTVEAPRAPFIRAFPPRIAALVNNSIRDQPSSKIRRRRAQRMAVNARRWRGCFLEGGDAWARREAEKGSSKSWKTSDWEEASKRVRHGSSTEKKEFIFYVLLFLTLIDRSKL